MALTEHIIGNYTPGKYHNISVEVIGTDVYATLDGNRQLLGTIANTIADRTTFGNRDGSTQALHFDGLIAQTRCYQDPLDAVQRDKLRRFVPRPSGMPSPVFSHENPVLYFSTEDNVGVEFVDRLGTSTKAEKENWAGVAIETDAQPETLSGHPRDPTNNEVNRAVSFPISFPCGGE